MAYYFPEGSKFYFSKTFAAAKTVSAITNASPAVATATAHGYVDGDEILLTSGWEDATDTVFRVDQQTADTFQLLGLNSVNLNFYPAGSGAGEAQKISTWVEIPQVLGISTSGGDARFTTISPLAKRNDINVPTGFNAMSINVTLGHDPDNANYQQMLDISRTLEKVAFKMVLSGGAVAYGYGYMSVSEAPQLNRNQANQVNAAITLLGRFMSYAV
ncbi:phage tail tube protein [Caldimonas sp.]|uniref:phage tail tube protein n=1 Tax=Caldimonas sp. TaxID=2838790 RepID=UPI00391D4143